MRSLGGREKVEGTKNGERVGEGSGLRWGWWWGDESKK